MYKKKKKVGIFQKIKQDVSSIAKKGSEAKMKYEAYRLNQELKASQRRKQELKKLQQQVMIEKEKKAISNLKKKRDKLRSSNSIFSSSSKPSRGFQRVKFEPAFK